VLRNTKWVYGAVIYAGHDTKLMMNTGMILASLHDCVQFVLNLKLQSVFLLSYRSQ